MKPSSLLLILFALPVTADIYKHVDEEGRITYSNIPSKGAKKLDMGPIPLSVPGTRVYSGGHGGGKSSSQPTPASFPRVDTATQRNRDQTKLQILNDELGNEQKLLEESRKRLAAAPTDAKQRDNALMHEKNIETLRKEISRVQ
ncbi:DUF4124 domain-containing protein [Chitinimonas arctica]|uniref:DUF4124 domain-containing protein n=1 Tax=Chitinimonas arctica TaxID=2594795 RepID=A0A516SG34_9NEIS|nr:DUF4124 domain-containing protein [Chitinimonas arctica]QDQ27123.1 DUF4124 domain-containing protein [Chitinimonas arctica]